ncbi:PRC-barrel domain-containing protein [Streptosporangium subroseum]|uniref:PRC-barrel domain-containing protein n=1 Tax=Streptosporangium subroseum TaxID=106412 RepID=UPI003085DA84|nr:PRC-barrel domain-containing protein [Streptosporangium subroseum]
MIENMWDYSPQAYSDDQKLDLVGFDVEATDGKIGSVDEENNVVGDSYIVVDTGFWIFGKKVVLPAGTVHRVDPQERKIYVARTKEEIKNAPEFDEETYREPSYRDSLGGYYGGPL